jgi:hypothetical protein
VGVAILSPLAVLTGPTQAISVKSEGSASAVQAAKADESMTMVIDEKGNTTSVPSSSLDSSVPTVSAATTFPRNGYGSAVRVINSLRRFDVTVDGHSSSARRTDVKLVSATQFNGRVLTQMRVADRSEMRIYVNGHKKLDTGIKNVGVTQSRINWKPGGIYSDKEGKGIEVWVAFRDFRTGKWYVSSAPFNA